MAGKVRLSLAQGGFAHATTLRLNRNGNPKSLVRAKPWLDSFRHNGGFSATRTQHASARSRPNSRARSCNTRSPPLVALCRRERLASR
jgi:hypothetical protein